MERLTGKELRRLSEFLRELYQLRTHQEFTNHLLTALPAIAEDEGAPCKEMDRHQSSSAFKTDSPVFQGNPKHNGHGLAPRPTVTLPCNISKTLEADPLSPSILAFNFQNGSRHSLKVAPHNKSERACSNRTKDVLNAIRPHVLQGLRNALAVTQMQEQIAVLDKALEEGQQAVLSVTAEGRIHFSTPLTQQLFARYGMRTRRGSDRLPPSLRTWLRSQVERLTSSDNVAEPVSAHTIPGRSGTLHIHITPQETHYLLMLCESRPQPRTDLLLLGLSPRESEILGWVIKGKTNPEIGLILGISPRTVQKHLERLYGHLGVESRHAAIQLAISSRATSQ